MISEVRIMQTYFTNSRAVLGFRPQGCYENIAGGRKVLECVAITYDSDHTAHHSIFRRNTPT